MNILDYGRIYNSDNVVEINSLSERGKNMTNDFKKVADELLKAPGSSKLKKDEIKKIMGSEDGQKIKKMLEGDGTDLMGAVRKGDTDTLKNALEGILKTEEGARMAEKIMKMMK